METTKKESFFSGLTKNTFLLALTSLFSDISSEMLYPILPIFQTGFQTGAGLPTCDCLLLILNERRIYNLKKR